jgi:carbamoyltransferase
VSKNVASIPRWRLPESWRPEHPVFAFHEDTNANAVLITPKGEIFAVAEERLSRNRFSGGFPQLSLKWIQQASGIDLDRAKVLVFGNRTHFLPRILGSHFPSFEHDFFGFMHKLMLLYHHLCFRSRTFSSFMESFNRFLLKRRFGKKIKIIDHHFAHAASAYFTSGQTKACAVSIDNYGDGFSAKVFECKGADIRYIRGSSALNSPGQFYGEIAQIAGIKPLLAGKLTGMAAHGKPVVAESMRQLFDVTKNGTDFSSTFGWGRNAGKEPFKSFSSINQIDLAASAQLQFENTIVKYVQKAVSDTGQGHVVLAGGCFANVRVNQRILELPEVESVWIHPAMSDQGISMGAALAHIANTQKPLPFTMENILLGPESTENEMLAGLKKHGLPFAKPDNIAAEAAELLAQGNILARFDGPVEYGLRALGNRSILHSTTDPDLQSRLNKKLHRAPYMPFAPVTMAPHAAKCYVDVERASEAGRFMTISFYATDWMKKVSPGVVHIDGTVRPQILQASDNPGMYDILEIYHAKTGIPSLLNTSFNMHEEPIVATADDACKAFGLAKLDYLILGPFLVRQPMVERMV